MTTNLDRREGVVWHRFFAKSVIHGALELSGAPASKRRQTAGSLHILTYHSFSSGWAARPETSVPIRRFEKQLEFLRRNFRVVSLAEGMTLLQSGPHDGPPLLAISIDDGFEDNYSLAWPVLRKYGVPATIFLAADFIDSNRVPWPTRLRELVWRSEKTSFVSPLLGANEESVSLDSVAARQWLAERLKRVVGEMPPGARFEAIDELQVLLGVRETSGRKPLSWDQVREMRDDGISFGSHTRYHSMLPRMPDEVLDAELRDSKARLESELDQPCTLFAYPDGQHDARTRKALVGAGYELAATQDLGTNGAGCDPLALKRIEIPFHDPLPTFRCRVSLALGRGRG